jgi:hypothetical protein
MGKGGGYGHSPIFGRLRPQISSVVGHERRSAIAAPKRRKGVGSFETLDAIPHSMAGLFSWPSEVPLSHIFQSFRFADLPGLISIAKREADNRSVESYVINAIRVHQRKRRTTAGRIKSVGRSTPQIDFDRGA